MMAICGTFADPAARTVKETEVAECMGERGFGLTPNNPPNTQARKNAMKKGPTLRSLDNRRAEIPLRNGPRTGKSLRARGWIVHPMSSRISFWQTGLLMSQRAAGGLEAPRPIRLKRKSFGMQVFGHQQYGVGNPRAYFCSKCMFSQSRLAKLQETSHQTLGRQQKNCARLARLGPKPHESKVAVSLGNI